MTEMQGAYVGSRPIRLATATPKVGCHNLDSVSLTPFPLYTLQKLEATQTTVTPPSINTTLYDPSNLNNTTIFIGNLSPSVTEEELRRFAAYHKAYLLIIVLPTPQHFCAIRRTCICENSRRERMWIRSICPPVLCRKCDGVFAWETYRYVSWLPSIIGVARTPMLTSINSEWLGPQPVRLSWGRSGTETSTTNAAVLTTQHSL